MDQKPCVKFTSRWGFILSAAGSAVGMANVWGFPAKLGTNGGGAFLVAYLIFIALFSSVGLSAETLSATAPKQAHWVPTGPHGLPGTKRQVALAAFWGGCPWPALFALPLAMLSLFPMY